jgi:hypothetical protein
MLPVEPWLNRNAMWLRGSQAKNSPPQAGGGPQGECPHLADNAAAHVDGADEAKRCVVDEVRAYALACVHGHSQ